MEKILRIETSERMSKAVVHNGTAYLCGQVAGDRTEGIKGQTISTLERVEAVLASAGTDKTKILSATIYLKDMKDYGEMNEIWDAWLPQGEAPARACVKADMAAEDILVEVSIIAAV